MPEYTEEQKIEKKRIALENLAKGREKGAARKEARLAAMAKARAARAAKTDTVVDPLSGQPLNPIEPIDTPIKHRATQPWKPARLMDIPEDLKEPGFRYRPCRNESVNIHKKIAEGWEVDRELQRKMDARLGLPTTLDDPKSSLDSTTHMRELIVMRMPETMALEREKYFDSITPDPPKAAKAEQQAAVRREMNQESAEGMGSVYGGIEGTVDNRKRA